MIDFTCPCGRQYHADDSFLGKCVRCNNCQAKYYVGKRGDDSSDDSVPVLPVSLKLGEGAVSEVPICVDAEVKAQSISSRTESASEAGSQVVPKLIPSSSAVENHNNVEAPMDSSDGRARAESSEAGSEMKTEIERGEADKQEKPFKLSSDWSRFFGRLMDFLIFNICFTLFCGVFYLFAGAPEKSTEQVDNFSAIGYLPELFLFFIVDGMVYSLFGNTLGKWLMGVAIVDDNLKPIGGKAYLKRNLFIWMYAYAFGLPLVSLFTMCYQSQRMKKGKKPVYDEKLGTMAIVKGDNFFRTLLWLLLLFLVMYIHVKLQLA